MKTPRLMGPWLVLPLGVTAAVVAVTLHQLRAAGYVLAAGLGAAAVLRAILPARTAGAVAVRSRAVDVLLLAGAAMAAAILAATTKLTV